MAATTLSRWTPTFPTGVINMLNPFASEGSNPAISRQSTPDSSSKKRAVMSNGTAPVGAPPSPSRSSSSVMFAEPDSRNNSETGSRPGSSAGGATKRSNRPKTRFSVCHPPPTSSTRQRLHRRPRSLLQLHVLTPDARPRPAFDVIHAANFSVKLTRAVTKVFKARHSLCPNDLVVMRAEKYEMEEDDDEQEMRDVIGLICKGKKEEGGVAGKAKICLASGMEWEAGQLPNGGYEFLSTDDHGLGLTVRWVPKRIKEGSKCKDKRFNFSTISPNTRRHPVIASLTKTSLEVNDRYKMPDPSLTTPLSTPKQNSTILTDAMEEDEAGGSEQHETDDLLREIITMTGIWVTFKEGWSPTFKYDDKDKDSSGPQRTNSISVSLASPTDAPGSPGKPGMDKRNSIKSVSSSIFRRSSMMSKAQRVSISTITVNGGPDHPQHESPSRNNSIRQTGRPRGDSNATVLVHRAASNRQQKKNLHHQQSSWQADFLAANDALPEHVGGSSAHETPSRKSSGHPPRDAKSESDSDEDDDEGTDEGQSVPAATTAPPSTNADTPNSSLVSNGASAQTGQARNGHAPSDLSKSPTKPQRGANGSSNSDGKGLRKKRSAWRSLLCGVRSRDE